MLSRLGRKDIETRVAVRAPCALGGKQTSASCSSARRTTLLSMDTDWARERLEEYLSLCGELTAYRRRGVADWDDYCEELNDRATEALATVSRIVRLVDPDVTATLMPPSYASHDSVRVIRQTLGALNDRSEWETRLAPESPILQAQQFHPVVWRAASAIWETREFKVASQQAAVSLSAHIKARAKSPLSDRKLMQQVFSPDAPRREQVRLHFPGDRADETWQSRQQGLHLLAQGAYAGIRNVAVHDSSEWSEHEALEHLAVLSVVARWADETEVVEAN